jgi:hypothetical protein
MQMNRNDEKRERRWDEDNRGRDGRRKWWRDERGRKREKEVVERTKEWEKRETER